jgi:ATP-dependent Lon protease
MVLTMALESEEAAQALEAAHPASEHLVLVPFIEGRYSPIGVIAQVLESGEIDNGPRAVVVAAIERAHIGAAVPSPGNALWVQVDPIEPEPADERSRELAREYRAVLESILHTRGARRLAAQLADVTEQGAVADLAGYSPDLSAAQKVQVLETLEVERRLELVLGWARETLAEIALRERIKDNVEEGLEKNQREFLLRRQLDAIRRELGELDGSADEDPDGYRRRIDGWGAPPETVERVRREIDRLERTSADAPESGWIRTWLDRVLALPFGEESSDNLDLTEARRVLDEDHEGLDEVKRRIVEHLGVAKLRRDRGLQELKRGSGAILALAGPPRRRQDLPR